MSLIEQAAQRLEQLRKAGVDIPESTPQESPPESKAPVSPPGQNARPEASAKAQVKEPESIQTPEMAM